MTMVDDTRSGDEYGPSVEGPETPDDEPGLTLALAIELVRHPRGKCDTCGLRRILYSLAALGDHAQLGGGAESPRRCAVDAGIIR